MAEIKVNVTAGKQQKVTVSSTQNSTEILASADTGRFWAQTAKNWAVSDVIVDNTDYSSKHYAQAAKNSAINAQDFENATREIYNGFSGEVVDAIANVQDTRDEVITEIENNKAAAIDSMNVVKNETIDSINNTKATILNDIEFVADGEKKEIEGLADEIKDNADAIINRVGLNMFDTILKDHILTYEESKGLALQGTYVYKTAIAGERFGYPDFYNKVIEEYNEATATETVNGVTVKVHSNGHKFYDIANKSAIDSSFNSLGTAWYYGVDTANKRVFLPRSNYVTSYVANGNKTVSVYGNGMTLGLTDGVSNAGIVGNFTSNSHFIMTTKKDYGKSVGTDYSSSPGYLDNVLAGITTDAKKSGITGTVNITNSQTGMYLYICVGNTVSDTSWVDVVTQVNGGVKDLEDKTNEGIERLRQSSTALTQAQITNCITEIPQRIKYTLENGTLTIKAGSKVIVPNGFKADGVTKRFDEVMIERDLSLNPASLGSETRALFINTTNNARNLGVLRYCKSGTTPEQGFYYHTGENKMYVDTVLREGLSFPLMYGEWVKDAGYSSIDQVFNGMGYIGSTVWVDKGVKGLIPNGRNKDGSLKNIEVTTNSVSTIQVGEKSREVTAFLFNTGEITKWGSDNGNIRQYKSRPATPEKTYVKAYIEDENVWWYGDNTTTWVEKQYLVPLFKVYTNANAQILSADLKFPFRAIDYSDSSTISGSGMPSNKYVNLTFGATGTKYTAPANGWFGLTWWTTATATTYLRLHNITSGLGMLLVPNQGSAYEQELFVPVKKGDVVGLYYGNVESASSTAHTKYFRFIYAQGEV